MKKQFLETGKIVTTHGIKGEVKVMPWCDDPQMFLELKKLYLEKGKKEIQIDGARLQKNMVLLKINGIDDMTAAQAMRGKILYLNRDDIKLDDSEYFIQDLIGLTVKDADSGKVYGELVDVSETGANDVYHIKFEDGSIKLIPAIKNVIIKTDIDNNIMEIRPLAGLFDDED